MTRKKSLLQLLFASILLFGFGSCQLFENDVQDFMEKYTETAAIEDYNIDVSTYRDGDSHLCIASEQDAGITFYMRNPKKFKLIPSVKFKNLDESFSIADVSIKQKSSSTISLSLPQTFLIPVDEGQNISAEIRLYEPMSGRDFDRFNVSLRCNSKPPVILNPTVLNNNNQNFVVAFDMPNEEDVAVRHKDLSEVIINGKSYPVTVTTIPDPDADEETKDVKLARYTFTDSHFKRTYDSNYKDIGKKYFEHKENISVYFETEDAFFAGDKEYKITLKDKAGLSSTVTASTKISKLLKPVIKDQSGYEIPEGVLAGIPYDEDTEKGFITIEPPTKDHLGYNVSGATVHYKVYEATGSGRIYTSGTTTTAKQLELPQNTYRVEAYATLTNYENSATATVKFRFMNNILFVRACTDAAGFIGDGSAAAPYSTFEQALNDINDTVNRPDPASKFTIYVEGDFTQQTYYAHMEDTDSDPATPPEKVVNQNYYGNILLEGEIRTNELVITRSPQAKEPVIIQSITLDDSTTPLSIAKLSVGNIQITNNSGDGIKHDSLAKLSLKETVITGCTQDGIHSEHSVAHAPGDLIISGGEISSCQGIGICTYANTTIDGTTIKNNTAHGIGCGNGDDIDCIISNVLVTGNGSSGEAAIYVDAGKLTMLSGTVKNNHQQGIVCSDSTFILTGGSITNNKAKGIIVQGTSNFCLSGNPVIQNNNTLTSGTPINVELRAVNLINVTGKLTTGAKIGVTTSTVPANIGDPAIVFTKDYGKYNTVSSSNFFVSDAGFSIVNTSGEAGIVKAGSTGGSYNADDFDFTFAIDSTSATAGTSKTFTITPDITRQEHATPPYTTPLWLGNDNKLYLESDHSVSAGSPSPVTWQISLWNAGSQVTTLTPTISNGKLRVTLPGLLTSTYTIKVTAIYLGQPHGTEFDITVTAQ